MAFMNGGLLAASQAISMRLLIVEDEADLRRGLEQALREEGYAVDASGEGADAIYKAETWDYDAIVLDVMLPGLDGWEILRKLRLKKKTPVLLLTARDAVRDRVRGLDLGADDYLVKPFDLDELLARVRSLIRRAAGRCPNPVLDLGPVSINTAARTVAVDGGEVALTAREYALIEYLATRRGKVVAGRNFTIICSRRRTNLRSNLLDVHVCNLRRKLGKDLI